MGLSFLWNGIDLGDLFISEFTAGMHPTERIKKNKKIKQVIMALKGFLKCGLTKSLRNKKKAKV